MKEEDKKEESINEARKLLEQLIDRGTKSQQAEVLSLLTLCYEQINYEDEMVRTYKECLGLRIWRFWRINRDKSNNLWEIQRDAFRRLIAISQDIRDIGIHDNIIKIIEKHESRFSKDGDVKKDLINWRKEPPSLLTAQPIVE